MKSNAMISIAEFESCRAAAEAAASAIVQQIEAHLSDEKLLLVSGGSASSVTSYLSTKLNMNNTNGVQVAQVDERYGPVGHADSNWQHLKDKGFDPIMFERAIEMLALGNSISDVSVNYNRELKEVLQQTSHKIALLGIGVDGHIAGMLPGDVGFFDTFLNEEYVVDFEAHDYSRITITARALLKMDEIIVFACGPEKKAMLDKLSEDIPMHEFPAQMLKQCKKVSVFFGHNDG